MQESYENDELKGNVGGREGNVKRPSILEWYLILRTRHQWTIFQAIRYALWLAR